MNEAIGGFTGRVDAADDGLVTIVVDVNCAPRIFAGDRVHVTWRHPMPILHPDGVQAANAVTFGGVFEEYVLDVIQAYLAASGERP